MMRDGLLVAGVIFLTILYLWIVHASYAPAIVVGEGRNECLTGNDCGSAWECLWPCESGHLWGTDDPNGWECLWPCPTTTTVFTGQWMQSFEGDTCDAEYGTPAASVDVVGTSSSCACDETSLHTEGAESGDWQWPGSPAKGYCYTHNYGEALDFSSYETIYISFDVYKIQQDIWGWADYYMKGTDGAANNALYPMLFSRYAFFAANYTWIECGANPQEATNYWDLGGFANNAWHRVFINWKTGSGEAITAWAYKWNGSAWTSIPMVNHNCTTDQENPLAGLRVGSHTDNPNGWASPFFFDRVIYSATALADPGPDPE